MPRTLRMARVYQDDLDDDECYARVVKVVAIPRVRRPTVADFTQTYVAGNRPVVVEGLLDDVPARGKWSFEWFARHYGERDIAVIRTAARRAESGERYEPRRLGEYLDALRGDPNLPFYMSEAPFFEQAPELLADVPPPPLVPNDRRIERRLWLGPAGSVSHYHKDNHFSFARIESLFMQIEGEKKFLLVAPADDARMYQAEQKPGSLDENYAFQSLVDAERPDLERFPLYDGVTVHEAVVRTGECVLIPAGWWHYVRGLTPCISVSNWWMESRVADLVTRLTEAPDPIAFLGEHAGSLSADDARFFVRDANALGAALSLFTPEQLTAVLALFSEEAREVLRAHGVGA